MVIKEAKEFVGEAIALLQMFNLPVNDLPTGLENFFVMVDNGKVVGVIGLEIYSQYGLLRSLAVDKDVQSKGVASKLIEKVENIATDKVLQGVYLLTETAPDYFKSKGYRVVQRSEVALPIRQSSEFKETCPVSATIMIKTVNANQ